MIEHAGWYLPDGESHMQKFIGEGRPYQSQTHVVAMLASDHYNLALDIGAHVGMWSWSLCTQFKRVIAFEPVAQFAECITRNAPRAQIVNCAIGKEVGTVAIHIPSDNTGAAYVAPDGVGVNVPCRTLDSLDYQPDFIKIDIEGWELFALQGGEEMLKKCWPVVCVECKRGPARYGIGQTAAVQYLFDLGYDFAVAAIEDWIVKRKRYTD